MSSQQTLAPRVTGRTLLDLMDSGAPEQEVHRAFIALREAPVLIKPIDDRSEWGTLLDVSVGPGGWQIHVFIDGHVRAYQRDQVVRLTQ